MIYKDIKDIFIDTPYGLIDYKIEVEYQEEHLTMNLFQKNTADYITLKLNTHKIETIEQLKEKISTILNMS